jgi:hypothetical protein
MSILQKINNKANIRKLSEADIPFQPKVPVLNRYEAESTASQTVINLNFSVDQENKEAFQLFIDGKLLREGLTNDYTFTSIGFDNTSSQVTLTFSLPAVLNIIAIKLGAKKESDFGSDNRFTQMRNIQTYSSSTALTNYNSIVLTNASSGSITMTLPSASSVRGAVLNIKKIDSSLNPVHISALSSTIDGSSSVSLLYQWDSLSITSDGTNFYLI